MSIPAPVGIPANTWQEALAATTKDPILAAMALVEKGALSEVDSNSYRAEILGFDYASAVDFKRLDPAITGKTGYRQAQRLGVIPACSNDGVLEIWTRPDINWHVFLELQAEFGMAISITMLSSQAFNEALQRAYERSGATADAVQVLDENLDLQSASAGLPESLELLDSQDDAPIIRFLNAVISQAIDEGASDIHIEPFETRVVVRYRVDGVLRDMVEPPGTLAGRIAARIKVMARLNIAEKRVPQDGRISLSLAGRTVDVRVSTLPTHYGERVVMRILEKEKGPLGLEQIGMSLELREKFTELILSPYGIFLVSGPTGSGKTTTLYAALQEVRSKDVNIITVEDPVEYDLQGIGQIPVNNKTGMTFDKGLRAILRQDPDVIMVGEIRDLETAEVAVQASLTGHRVFSTLHTNDAVGSITRLMDMGVESYLVASSLIGTMAQRLVRRLCQDCRVPHSPDTGERQLLGVSTRKDVTIYYPGGCEACGYTGYRGRTGIYELMVVNDDVRRLIHDNQGEQSLRQAAEDNGMQGLRADGLLKVRDGITSLEEVLRVTLSHGRV